MYDSSRIKHLGSWCRDHTIPFCILSAERGLIDGDTIIEKYERVMDSTRAAELVPQVALKLRGFDAVVFFKGGARYSYADCIRQAAIASECPVALIEVLMFVDFARYV